MIVKCFMCGQDFERKRSHAHYCYPCTRKRNRNLDRIRKAERRKELREVADRVARGNPYDVSVTLGAIEAVIADEEERGALLAMNENPPGSRSEYGAEEGRSTFDTNLMDELDTLSIRASLHPWWVDNPHWNIGL